MKLKRIEDQQLYQIGSKGLGEREMCIRSSDLQLVVMEDGKGLTS